MSNQGPQKGRIEKTREMLNRARARAAEALRQARIRERAAQLVAAAPVVANQALQLPGQYPNATAAVTGAAAVAANFYFNPTRGFLSLFDGGVAFVEGVLASRAVQAVPGFVAAVPNQVADVVERVRNRKRARDEQEAVPAQAQAPQQDAPALQPQVQAPQQDAPVAVDPEMEAPEAKKARKDDAPIGGEVAAQQAVVVEQQPAPVVPVVVMGEAEVQQQPAPVVAQPVPVVEQVPAPVLFNHGTEGLRDSTSSNSSRGKKRSRPGKR